MELALRHRFFIVPAKWLLAYRKICVPSVPEYKDLPLCTGKFNNAWNNISTFFIHVQGVGRN